MPRVFLLTSPDGPTGARTQARLALDHLPSLVHETTTTPLRSAWDFAALSALRQQLSKFAPDLLHAVGPAAVASAALLRLPKIGLRPWPRLIVSGCDSAPTWLAKWGSRKAETVLAYSPAEQVRYRRFVPDQRIHLMRPGVANLEFLRGTVKDPARRTIAVVGNFDRLSGMKTAVWAFDVLKYIDPQLRLLLIGDGPNRAEVDRFGRALGYDDYRVEFVGERPNVPQLLVLADIVWITHERGGVCVALEAMAAGVPVVAFRTDDLDSVLSPGDGAILVPTGDRVQLASATAELLAKPEECVRLGRRGQAVAATFSTAALAHATAAAYDGRSGPPR